MKLNHTLVTIVMNGNDVNDDDDMLMIGWKRWMPLEGLSQSEQLAVFLNLYHVMLLHAFFILGPPGSPLR